MDHVSDGKARSKYTVLSARLLLKEGISSSMTSKEILEQLRALAKYPEFKWVGRGVNSYEVIPPANRCFLVKVRNEWLPTRKIKLKNNNVLTDEGAIPVGECGGVKCQDVSSDLDQVHE